MSNFRKQLVPPPAHRSWVRPFRPSVPTPAVLSSAPSSDLRLQPGDVSVVGPSTCREKRKRPVEFDLMKPPPVNPKSLMATSRGAAREAQAEQVQLERMTEIAATQPGVEEGYTLDVDIVEVIKRLLWYLQLVVTLMATMVHSFEESKCGKRGVGRHWSRLQA